MLGVRAAAEATAERLIDQLAVEAVLEFHEPGPPLGVARAGGHVDGLVARDADIALQHDDADRGDEREDQADVPRLHSRLQRSADPPICRPGRSLVPGSLTL